MEKTTSDTKFMLRALTLARAVKGNTFPNPAVGAVIVKAKKIVGEGATQICGGPHAEKVALKSAGALARGASLYVTLEPCAHFGRTPPCTDAIIEAGIKRVFVAVKDPNPLVASKGLAKLRKAGIIVQLGCMAQEAYELNEDFFYYIVKKRPWITLKLAQTLDGRIADAHGASKWITSPKSRNFVQELRRTHAAVAVGRLTLEKDNPQLTVRELEGCSWTPARIVFSSNRNVDPRLHFCKEAGKVRSIVVVRGKGKRRIETTATGLEYWFTGKSNQGEHIAAFLEMAYEQDLPSILIEGGQQIASVFLEKGLVNRLYLFYGNKIFGKGLQGIEFQKGLPVDKAIVLDKMKICSFDNDVMVTGTPLIL